MNALTNVSSPIADLSLQVLKTAAAGVVAPVLAKPTQEPAGAPGGLLSIEREVRASAKAPKIKAATDHATSKGIATLADVVTSVLMGGANIHGALALFGEAAGIAGDRDRVNATLRNVATQPDKFIPAGTSLDVRNRILRLVDQGRDASEFSRAVSAVTAGSALTFYIAAAKAMAADIDGGMTAMARVTKKLVGPCAAARTENGAPVDSTWAGCGIDLADILRVASEQERASRAKTTGARAEARETAKQGSAGRTDDVRTSNATTAAGLAVALGGPVPEGTPKALTGTATEAPSTADNAAVAAALTGAPVTQVPAGKSGLNEPAADKVPAPAWARAIDNASQALNGLGALVPNAALKRVNTDMELVLSALVRMRKACAEAEAAAKAGANLPTGRLVKQS